MLNNVACNYILQQIFNNLKNRRKLKIVKYNKVLLNRLYISKEDFKAYEELKEFNKNYKLNIGDIDIQELDLLNKFIRNEGLEHLSKIGFKDLINLKSFL